MKYTAILLCALSLLVSACAALAPSAAAKGVKAIGAVNAQPPLPEVTETGASNESEAGSSDLPALELVALGEEGDGLSARAVDPLSLAGLPGHSAIDFGHHYTHALSPDGRALALIAWPSGMHNQEGVLHLIQLPAWIDHVTEVTFDYFVGELLFSPDGKSLYWSEPGRLDPEHGLPVEHRLYRYDLNSRLRTEILPFPPSIVPWETRVLDAGSRLAVYGLPTTSDNLAEDVPHVLLVDLDTGRLAADLRLEGVTAGQLRLDGAGVNESPYRIYQPGLAWDPERGLLYVVHADSDRITVVDLTKGEVRRQVELRPSQPFLERLLNWLATPAQAKSVPGIEKWAALAPAGDRLYVVGLRTELEWAEDSQEWTRRQFPLGLQVIATDTLTELQQLDLPVNNLALSLDGKWLLLAGAYDVTGAGGQMERAALGLYLVDGQTLQVTAHLLPEIEVALHGFSEDGHYAYISTSSGEWLGDRWCEWRVRLHVMELAKGLFLADREFAGYFIELIR